MNFKVNIKVCRVCMKSEEGVSLYRDPDLQSKFVFTTRLSIKPSDNMPSIICPKCTMRLKVAFDFVQLAHASEKNLKAFLARISSDFQEVTKITTSVNSTSPLPGDDHDEISAVFEDTIDNNSKKDEIKEHLRIDSKAELSKVGPITMKLGSSTTQTLKTPKLKVMKVESEKQPQFKQEFTEFSADDEESVGYEEANFLDEGENEEDEDKGMTLETTGENRSNERDKSTAEQNQVNGYLEEFVMATEQDASSCNENLSTHYIYENTTEDEGNYEEHDEAMELEIEMQEKSAPDSSVVADEALQLYEDTEEELPNETNENLISTENVENVEDKDYLHLELSDDEHASVVLFAKSGDIRPIEIEKTKQTTIIPSLKQIKTISVAEGAEVREDEISATKEEGVTSVASRTSQKVGRFGKISSSGSSINARFFCVKCNRDFSTKTNLTRHMATHEGIKPYQCTECNKSFSQNGSLKQHMYTHTGEKPFICEVCDRGFTQCKSLVFHMRRHTGEKPFPCEHCGMFFRQKDGLKTHILKHHMIRQTDGDNETLICVICEKLLDTKYALQVHMKKHINYHRFVPHNSPQGTLATADNSFPDIVSEDELISEKAFISEELALNIDDVTSSTQILDTMTANTAKASRVKKFQCRKCYKCFAIKKNLLRHLATHDVSASELFQCQLCQVAFDTNYALRVHRVREHRETGINLNECELCNITFANSTELSDHNNAFHDATDQNCPACPELNFSNQKQLLKHLLGHEKSNIYEDD